MTDHSLSAYAPPSVIVPRVGASIWAPGLWLMRPLSLRRKLLVLLLSAWLPLLLLVLVLPMSGSMPPLEIAGLEALRAWVAGQVAVAGLHRWALLGLLATAVLAPMYLAACTSRSIAEGLDLMRRGAQDMASGKPGPSVQGFGSDELGQTLDALAAARGQMARLQQALGQQGGVTSRCTSELADTHLAMQLAAVEVRAAIGEIARRTVALCGMLDSDVQDAERASADLDAIHDEEVQSLQLMAALRSRLLVLAHHCQALGDAARGAVAPQPEVAGEAAGESAGELSAAAALEITHCHQLSERVGGAERLNERRIESMRRSTDRLVCRAERGVREGQQLMVLTRQVEAALATLLQRLEQMGASCASLRSLVEPPVSAQPTTTPMPESLPA